VVALVVALCFLAGVGGWLIGRSDDGDESFSAVDVGFLADMSTHHNGAISMSLDYLNRGADSIVGHFARDILLAQTQEIAVMNALLDDSGDTRASSDDIAMDWMGMTVPESAMPGMPTAEESQQLAAASGASADDVFTTLMIRHHAAGAAMAEYAAEHGENDRVRRLARAMARVQRTEIAELNARRVVLGLPEVTAESLEALVDRHAH
jgi:uncharacterized protein (DUF305 family)